MIEISNANIPSWKTINVKSQIPESLKKLDTIAHNMWWSWNQDAKDLFAMPNIDGGLVGGASLKVADFTIIANS